MSGNFEDLQLEDNKADNNGTSVNEKSDFAENSFADNDYIDEELGDEEDAWDLGDDDLDVELDTAEEEIENQADISKLPKELKTWVKNSKTAGAYIAAGKFDIAASMLNKQAGIKNFEPFRQRFLEVYTSSKLSITTFDEETNGNLPVYISDVEKANEGKILGLVPGYDQLEDLVQEGFKLFKSNQLESSIEIFRKIIYIIATLSLTSDDEEGKCKEILDICKEYIIGLQIELTRRALPPTEIKRNLELAAYFTHVNLQPAHRLNALQVAMTQSFKAKNYHYASYFATEFLKIMSSGNRAEQARKIQAKSENIATDAISIDFDPFTEWEICAGDFVPIYKGEEIVREKMLGVGYGKSWKGKICKVTLVSEIGGIGSGLRLRN